MLFSLRACPGKAGGWGFFLFQLLKTFDKQLNNYLIPRNYKHYFYVIKQNEKQFCFTKGVLINKIYKNNFKKYSNCLIIYIKKPYFCVPKLET